ncbi:mercury(II) reductase [Acidithrix ferrooxidans]|uniref:Mercuric reductase n=1 Tax=Acidithrix ferrooxidans TaxID=1280514 RepID=A0A0D8HK30_9ACTN|nr:mercury(II) reductase [Acidithrix ferrooxidans]KJF18234.1 mercuric reductase [Acidithrix ferrooxidans]
MKNLLSVTVIISQTNYRYDTISVVAMLLESGATSIMQDESKHNIRFLLPIDKPLSEIEAALGRLHVETISIEIDNSAPVDESNDYDFIAIGSGSASFAAAIRAREAGLSVAIIEKDVVGGTCVNVGCIPSKALLRASEQIQEKRLSSNGAFRVQFEINQMIKNKDELVNSLRRSKYLDLAKDYGFDIIYGHASFVAKDKIEVGDRVLGAKYFLIATGASPYIPPIPGLFSTSYLTSTTALNTKSIPNRLCIVGAGSIGLELGQLFMNLGSQVTFIEAGEQIAPQEEAEISAILKDTLISQGATIYTSAQITRVNAKGSSRSIELTSQMDKVTIAFDKILIATTRKPNTNRLGLEKAGVEVTKDGAIVVNHLLQTTNPQIYSAGDVIGGPQFVYVAAYEGALAVDNCVLASNRSLDLTALPRVTFTNPPISGVGLRESEAKILGLDTITTILPLDQIPRSLVNGQTHGAIKLVADKSTRKLLGANIISEGAGDVIQAASLAIKYNISIDDLASSFHPYLTMAESLKLACQSFTKDVTKLSCCAS